jgi:hypothetical protein
MNEHITWHILFSAGRRLALPGHAVRVGTSALHWHWQVRGLVLGCFALQTGTSIVSYFLVSGAKEDGVQLATSGWPDDFRPL